LRRWEPRVGERANRDAHGLVVTFFGVEDRRPANWAESENETGAVVADASVFGGGAEDLKRNWEARQCREDAAGSLLAGEAMT
jgi:hypothetical protein